MLKFYKQHTRGEYCIAAVEGDFALPQLEFAANSLKTLSQEFPCLALDLSEVKTFDSAAFQLLAVLKKDAARRGTKFKLINHSAPVKNLLTLYGAIGLFRDKVIVSEEWKNDRFRYGLDEQVFF
jgi:anti-anti-sigma regulatory factor